MSLVGIELLTIDARIVIASVDTYLRFAEAVNRHGGDVNGLVPKHVMNGHAVMTPLLASTTEMDVRVRGAAVTALSEYVGRQQAGRIAAAKRPACEGLECRASQPRAPAGSAAPGTRPRNARTDINTPPRDPALSILNGLAEDDTLPVLAPITPGPEM